MTSTYSSRQRLELHFMVLVLALWPFVCKAAPLQDSADLQHYSEGCYYNYNYYNEGDRILTNEPCLNCTCHNKMLMCYLRVCPFTKPIGHDCTIEKREDQCCPIITCPEVPVELIDHQGSGTQLGFPQKHGCTVDGKYYSEGAQVPSSPNKPCELCYCIRNRTSCIMQECTLHVSGCQPIYHRGACCPVRYNCDYDTETEFLLEDESTTTVRPTPGFVLTTTLSPVGSTECTHNGDVYADGALIESDKPCEHCYCMRGKIVCAVQECEVPMDKQGANCTALPAKEGECCPNTYMCTEIEEVTTIAPTDEKLDKLPEEITTMEPISVDEERTTVRPPSFGPDLHEGISEEDVQLQQHIDDIPEHVTKVSDAAEISTDSVGTMQPSLEKVTLRPVEAEPYTESSTEFEKVDSFLGATTHIPLIDKESVSTEVSYLPPMGTGGTAEPPGQGLEDIEGSGYEGLTEVPDIESNEIVPISIPGEGDCLVDEVTYRNNTAVPPTNKCDESCACISSLIVCKKIKCEDPPKSDCTIVDTSTDSCCPIYKCEGGEEVEQVSTEVPGALLTPRIDEKEDEFTKVPVLEGEDFLGQTTEGYSAETSPAQVDKEVSKEKLPPSTQLYPEDLKPTTIPHIPGEIEMGALVTTPPSATSVLKEEETTTLKGLDEAEGMKSTSYLPTEGPLPSKVTDKFDKDHPQVSTQRVPTKTIEKVDLEKGLVPTEYPEEELLTTSKYPDLGESIDRATVLPSVLDGTYQRKEEGETPFVPVETSEETEDISTTLPPSIHKIAEKEHIGVEMVTEKLKPEISSDEGTTPSVHYIEEGVPTTIKSTRLEEDVEPEIPEETGAIEHTERPEMEEGAITERGPKVPVEIGASTEQPILESEVQETTQKLHPADLVTEIEGKIDTATQKAIKPEGEYEGPLEATTPEAEGQQEEIGVVTQKTLESMTGPQISEATTERMHPAEIEDRVEVETEKSIKEEQIEVESSTLTAHPEKLPHDVEQEDVVTAEPGQEIEEDHGTTKETGQTRVPEQVTEFFPIKEEEEGLGVTSTSPVSIAQVTEVLPIEHKDELESGSKVKTDQHEEDLFGTTLSEEDLFRDITTKLQGIEPSTESIKKVEPTQGVIPEEFATTETLIELSTEHSVTEGDKVLAEQKPKPEVSPESVAAGSEVPAVGDLTKPAAEEGIKADEGMKKAETTISPAEELPQEHEGEGTMPEKTDGIKQIPAPSIAPTYITEYPSATGAPEKLPIGVQEPRTSTTKYYETTEKLEPDLEKIDKPTERHEPKPSTQYPEESTATPVSVAELDISTKLYAKEEETQTEKTTEPEYATKPYFVKTPTPTRSKIDTEGEEGSTPKYDAEENVIDLGDLEGIPGGVPEHEKDRFPELLTTESVSALPTTNAPEVIEIEPVILEDVEIDKGTGGEEGIEPPSKGDESIEPIQKVDHIPIVPAEHPEESTERGGEISTENIEVSTDRGKTPIEYGEVSTERGGIPLEHGELVTERGAVEHGEEATESLEELTERGEQPTERGELPIKFGEVSTERGEVTIKPDDSATERGEVATERVEVPIQPSMVATELGEVSTERAEVSTERGEVSTERGEVTTKHGEVSTDRVEVPTDSGQVPTERGEVSTERAEVSTERGEVSTERGEVSTERGEVSTERGEVLTERGEVSTERGEASTERGEVSTERGEVLTERGEVLTERGEVSTERDQVLTERGEVSTERIKVSTELGEVTTEREVSTEREESTERGQVSTERGEVSTERGQVSTEHGEVSIERGEVSTERGEVSTERGEVSTERGEVSTERGEVSTERVEELTERGEVSTERGEVLRERGEVSTERGEMPIESGVLSTERGELPVEHGEISTERGEESTERGQIPIESGQVATERPEMLKERAEMSTERSEIPTERGEASTERGELPVGHAEVSPELGGIPIEHGEVSTERVETSTEHGQMPIEHVKASTEHGDIPIMPTEHEELSVTERGEIPVERGEASTERGEMPIEQAEASTEHGEIPVEHGEASTERASQMPIEQAEISTEHGEIPVQRGEASTERGGQMPIEQAEVSTEHGEISIEHGEIPVEREEASTEHGQIPIVHGEVSTERGVVPPKQGELPATRIEESTEAVGSIKDSLENEILKEKEPELEHLPEVPVAQSTTKRPPPYQTEKSTPDIIHEPVDKEENEVVPYEEGAVTEPVPVLPSEPQTLDESDKVDESHLPEITERPVNKTVPSDTTSPEPFQKPTRQPPQQPGYGQIPAHYPSYSEDDYAEEEESEVFGPGTCRYGGKLFVSAQQIPRDDPCDFCFCFRSDIICLQQSCPPPIPGCHEEPIQGFCCPRYECPVSMATVLNVTTSTTTTSTTLPPHFLHHAYNGAATKNGCHIQGKSYKIGDKIDSASGPCMQCTCGGDGQMKCEPKTCLPEPMLRQMIAVVASRRR